MPSFCFFMTFQSSTKCGCGCNCCGICFESWWGDRRCTLNFHFEVDQLFAHYNPHHKKDSSKISRSSLEMSRRRFKCIPNDRKVYVFYSNSCFSTSSSINCLQVRWSFSGWWFQILFIFTPIWRRFPFWLIFFKGVGSTTNWFCFGTGKWIRESTTVLRVSHSVSQLSDLDGGSYGQLLA